MIIVPGYGRNIARMVVLLAPLLLVAIGCSKDSVVVSPEEAASGSTVFLRLSRGIMSDPDEVEVRFGDRAGTVVRLHDASTVEVWVPKLEPGRVDVALIYEGRVRATSALTVVPPPLRRLFMTIEADSIVLTDVRPYNGNYDPPATSGRRISYDVLSEDGRLLYTGAMPFPEGRIEFFRGDRPGRPERRVMPGPVSFVLKVPFAVDPVRLRIYSAEPEVDLADPQSRKRREFLREIEIR